MVIQRLFQVAMQLANIIAPPSRIISNSTLLLSPNRGNPATCSGGKFLMSKFRSEHFLLPPDDFPVCFCFDLFDVLIAFVRHKPELLFSGVHTASRFRCLFGFPQKHIRSVWCLIGFFTFIRKIYYTFRSFGCRVSLSFT